jgi:UDP-N-acetylmuramoylalanine--D-glutamate ligase
VQNFTSSRITVMGLGRFGGGAGVARWLSAQGAHVLVTDSKTPEELGPALDEIVDLVVSGSIALRLGEHVMDDFVGVDGVVANPAIPMPWSNPYLKAATEANVPLLTEIGLVQRLLTSRERTIGVTGSAGKSTTASLIHHALKECGYETLIGGNLGGSLLLDHMNAGIPEKAWIVLELSSAMLHWNPAWSPHVAVLTNFAPNHLDWHGSLEHYEQSKKHLLANQKPGDIAVLGEGVAHWPCADGVRPIVVRGSFASGSPRPRLHIPGDHNLRNASLAVEALKAALPEVPESTWWTAMESFRGLPHRLEFIAEKRGIRCFNDSKATTPESTLLAATAFDIHRTHLIVGGYDKKVDLSPIATLGDQLAGLYTIGATGPAIAELARARGGQPHECETLEKAITAAFALAKPGETLLLSPGCASWGQFANYEERGDQFRTIVQAIE